MNFYKIVRMKLSAKHLLLKKVKENNINLYLWNGQEMFFDLLIFKAYCFVMKLGNNLNHCYLCSLLNKS